MHADGDVGARIEAQWQYLLEDAETAPWPGQKPLTEAAYAVPRLRALYPYTSHWELRFSSTPPPFTNDSIGLAVTKDGQFRVRDNDPAGPDLMRTPDPAEAAAFAAGRLSVSGAG